MIALIVIGNMSTMTIRGKKTYNQAKALVSKGLNIWGEPLPKK